MSGLIVGRTISAGRQIGGPFLDDHCRLWPIPATKACRSKISISSAICRAAAIGTEDEPGAANDPKQPLILIKRVL
jgi:hypothetical protein